MAAHPIYGSKRVKPEHDRSNLVLSQGKRILLSKIPPDVTADFRAISSSRLHYKAGTSFLINFESTLKHEENDMEIKRAMGLSDAKPATFDMELPKRSVTQMDRNEREDSPKEFTKNAL